MSMKACALPLFMALALCACGQAPAPGAPADPEAEAQAFAARINAAAAQDRGTGAPPIAPPLQQFGWGVCGETRMGAYLGRVANAPTRSEIATLVGNQIEVRFVRPGTVAFQPDATNPRLNLLLDSQDIIRDARCG